MCCVHGGAGSGGGVWGVQWGLISCSRSVQFKGRKEGKSPCFATGMTQVWLPSHHEPEGSTSESPARRERSSWPPTGTAEREHLRARRGSRGRSAEPARPSCKPQGAAPRGWGRGALVVRGGREVERRPRVWGQAASLTPLLPLRPPGWAPDGAAQPGPSRPGAQHCTRETHLLVKRKEKQRIPSCSHVTKSHWKPSQWEPSVTRSRQDVASQAPFKRRRELSSWS